MNRRMLESLGMLVLYAVPMFGAGCAARRPMESCGGSYRLLDAQGRAVEPLKVGP